MTQEPNTTSPAELAVRQIQWLQAIEGHLKYFHRVLEIYVALSIVGAALWCLIMVFGLRL